MKYPQRNSFEMAAHDVQFGVRALDDVMTPAGVTGRVTIVHPRGVLGRDGNAPNVKVTFTNGAVAWFHDTALRKIS